MLSNAYLVVYGTNLDIRGTKYGLLPKIDLKENPDYEFVPGNRYLVLWNDDAKKPEQQPYSIITKKIHLGPRRENHYDMTKMKYVLTRSGIIFKFVYVRYETETNWIDEQKYNEILPNIDKIAKKIRGAQVREIWSERKQKTYYTFSFEVPRDPNEDIENFLNKDDYIVDYPKIEYYKIIRETEDIKNAFDYFMTHEQLYGFDYETNSFPFDDPEFYHMGLGISGLDGNAAYFDLEYIQTLGGNLEYFKQRLREFCDKYEKNILTYNVSFEMRATYLLLHKLYMFSEGSTINKLDGLVEKNFSLKYTAMRCLLTSSWDDDFEILNEWLPELFGWDKETKRYTWSLTGGESAFIESTDEEGNPTTVEVDNYYKNNPVWKKIMSMYSEEEAEFDRLLKLYWGYSYKCIPSNILGKYCCWDAFNTVKLKEKALESYTEKAWNCFDMNLQLGALLNINGQYIDQKEHKYQEDTCYNIVAYGNLNFCIFELDRRIRLYPDLENIEIPGISNILRQGYNPFDFKPILLNLVKEGGNRGLDEAKLRNLFDDDFVQIIYKYIDDMCNGVFTSAYSRSRKIFTELAEEMYIKYKPKFTDDQCVFYVDGKEYIVNASYNELCSYYRNKSDLEYYKFLLNQLELETPHPIIKNIYGQEVDMQEILNECAATYNMSSNLITPHFKFNLLQEYKGEIFKCWIVLNKEEVIDGNTSVNIEDISEEDMKILTEHPDIKLFKIEDEVKEILEPKIGIIKEKIPNQYKEFLKTKNYFGLFFDALDAAIYHEPTGKLLEDGNPELKLGERADEVYHDVNYLLSHDINFMITGIGHMGLDNGEDDHYFKHFMKTIDQYDVTKKSIYSYCKLTFCYRAARKYAKLLGTYIQGQFSSYNTVANDYDDNWVSTERWHDYSELGSGYNLRSYSPFNVCQKQSKRWSAGSHTIPSKSQVKRCWNAPKGALLSYFDISGAEIRAISYLSHDEFMMHNYDLGLDPYIEFSKLDDPSLTPAQHKARRADFKKILLSTIYGMGIDMLASDIEKSVPEAIALRDKLFERLVQVKQIIDEKGEYCEAHYGRCESILGDVLMMGYEPDRWRRLGINQVIQSFAAVSLAQGFCNCIDVSLHTDEIKVRPINVVHDSSQNYFETKKLFEIFPYYHHNLTDYLYELYGVKYEFDLEVGANYYDMAHLKQISPTQISLEGSWITLHGILDKCREDGLPFRILEFKNLKKDLVLEHDGYHDPVEFKPKIVETVVGTFYALDEEGMAQFKIDKSKYYIVLEKIV